MFSKIISYLLLACCFTTLGLAQSAGHLPRRVAEPKVEGARGSELYAQIARADSLVFQAFNTCDSLSYQQYFTTDLEFYHDLGGLTVSLASELAALKEMCAQGSHIRRELIKSSLEVYPLKNYGAVEMGTHRFFHTNPGQPERPSGTYKFVQVWQRKDDQWKISRVISYGHTTIHND